MKKTIFALLALSLCHVGAQASVVYDVTAYGAVADTTVMSTDAMQAAIDACANAGGGIVLVPPGDYKISTIELRSNIELHLTAGASIYATRSQADYDYKKIAMGAADMSEAEVMVYALNAENVSITGKGMLHARAEREQYIGPEFVPKPGTRDLVTYREVKNAAESGADYRNKYRKVPPCPGIINFTGCRNATIRDIRCVESSGWGVHLQWCDRVVVTGVTILSSSINGVNSDGLDVDGCSDVNISDCVINTGDDALCLKTTRTEGIAMPCRDITVTNCILTSSSAALKLGTESHANFENITVSNCIIKGANRGINMIIRDGGDVRNVIFSDIIINTERHATFWWGNGDPVWLTTQTRAGAERSGDIQNVIFSNIIAHGQSGVRIEGFDSVVENVRFNNFQLFMDPEPAIDKRARNAFLFDGVKNLLMVDCEVTWDHENPEPLWESAYRFVNVDGAKLVRLVGDKAPGSSFDAIRVDDCKDVKFAD